MMFVLLILTAAVSMVAGCCGRWLWFLLWRRGGGSPSLALAPPASAGAPPPPARPPSPPARPPPPPPSGLIPAAASGPSPPQPQGVKQQAPDSDSLQKILIKLQVLENLMRSSESESSRRPGHRSRDGSTRSEAPRRRKSGGGHSRSGGRDRHDDYWYACVATHVLLLPVFSILYSYVYTDILSL